jgi:hypothetical protein
MSKINRWLREKQRNIVIVLCCLLMVSFVGVGTFLTNLGRGPKSEGGLVFDRSISGAEHLALARRLYRVAGGRLSSRDAQREAWRLLLLEEAAQEYGIVVSEKDLQAALARNFPRDEQEGLDQGKYAAYLNQLDLPPAAFEDLLRMRLAGEMLQNTIAESVTMTKEEAWLWHSVEREQAKARYLQFKADDLAPCVTIRRDEEEDELREFYELYKNRPAMKGHPGYQAPEKIKIEYVIAKEAFFRDSVEVTDKEIKSYYEEHREAFRMPDDEQGAAEGVDASAKDAAPTPEPTYKPLEAVRETIAQRLRDRKAAEKAEEAIDEVGDEIMAGTGTGDVRDVDFQSLPKQFLDARGIKLEYGRTDLFSAAEIDRVLPGAYALQRQAFGQSGSVLGIPRPKLTSDAGPFIYRILEARPAQPEDFDDVKEQVARDLRAEKSLRLAAQIVEDAVKANTTDFDAAVKAVTDALAETFDAAGVSPPDGKTVEELCTLGESDLFSRPRQFQNPYTGQTEFYARDTGLPGSFNYARFGRATFSLQNGQVTAAVEPSPQRAVFVLERIATREPDRAAFDQKAASLQQRYLVEKRRAVLQEWWRQTVISAAPSENILQAIGMGS